MWKYEGLCPSEEVFKALTGTDGSFKRKKITADAFCALLGCCSITQSIRYGSLSLTGDVNISWNAESKEFTFTGKYGI